MKIVCIGGGPAGLYFALLMKQQDPAHDITVVERNKPYDTFGWGVVFSDQTLGQPAPWPTRRPRPQILAGVQPLGRHRGQLQGPHDPLGRPRLLRHRPQALLNILQARCEAARREAGVRDRRRVRRPTTPTPTSSSPATASTAASAPSTPATFQPDIDTRPNAASSGSARTSCSTPSPSPSRRPSTAGSRRTPTSSTTTPSTFIVETPEDVWQAPASTRMDKEESIAFCEKLFAELPRRPPADVQRAPPARLGAVDQLPARRLRAAGSHFNGRAPVVLMGDAAHTAHFSIGSGTKLALEDAIELRALHRRARRGDLRRRAARYEARAQRRGAAASRTRRATRWSGSSTSTRYANLPPEQFAYSLLTRSQRISHENLRLRDKAYARRLRATGSPQRAGRAACRRTQPPLPPMFTPFTRARRHAEEPRRRLADGAVLVRRRHARRLSTSCTSARARMGGAGLVFAEMTCPSPDARITPGCPGLWNEAQRDAWKRIVDFVHAQHRREDRAAARPRRRRRARRACPGRARTSRSPTGNWPLISASPQQYLDGVSDWSRAMTRADMDRVRDDFVARDALRAPRPASTGSSCTARTATCCRSFISPLTNQRTDDYGGIARQPPALSARGVRRDARGLAAAPADVGAHLGARLGRRRHHARRRGARSRAPSRPPAPT